MNAMAPPAYAEFGIQTNFSFLRGASSPEQLVLASRLLEHVATGIADRNTVAGVVRGWSQAKVLQPEPKERPGGFFHPGCRLVFSDDTPDVLAYPQDRKGWGHLCRMLTEANFRTDSEKGDPRLYLEDLLQWGGHMSFAILPDFRTDRQARQALLRKLGTRFGTMLRLAIAPLYDGDDGWRLAEAAEAAADAKLPLMAINDVLYHSAEQRSLHDVLTAIRLNVTVSQAGHHLRANAERHLKPAVEMKRLFRRHPEAIAETIRFAGELRFSLRELSHNYPEDTSTPGIDPQTELEQLTWQGAQWRYPAGVPQAVKGTIRKELALVAQKDYARYFLTVRDVVQFARSKDILCQGRGSAANSVICYCLGITEVDPLLMNGLFERFISTERDEPPDIDVDFEHERRDEVMQYVYEKYSETRTALACAVTSYRSRSALREVAKAMGLSQDARSALSGSIWGWSSSRVGEKEARMGGLDLEDARSAHVMRLANEISGFPRHLTQHVGGFVITKDRLDEIVPIVKTAMPNRKMVEWDKDDLDTVGLIKVDILALGMLSCLRRAFDLLKEHYGLQHTLDSIKKEDQRVYDMICRADTLGVFQIESRAQMSMLPRLQPREFYDLVIEVAIVRPGPIQGNMVHPYLRRRMRKEKVDYPSPELEKILQRTLGVPLFQEQAMRIAIDAGGFTPGEADQLRRAMATFRRNGTITLYKTRMVEGMVKNGYDRDFAERCFSQIEGFGDYGFPESHAASFALLVYASCWFKTFYPDVFCAAILNSQPMGFYQPAQLVRDAADHGIEIREVDVNLSDWDCTLEPAACDRDRILAKHNQMHGVILSSHAVRLGFRQIKGLSKTAMELFVARRGEGYRSVRDVWLRSGLNAGEVERLAEADAFGSIGIDRRRALWEVKALDGRAATEMLPLFEGPQTDLLEMEPPVALPQMPPGEHVIHDYRSLSLSLKAHPVSFMRGRLDEIGITPNARLGSVRDGSRVSVAGLVLVRQRPGKGNAIFLTLEDEGSIANVILWARQFERFRPVVMGGRFIKVAGRLQSESGVIHIVAQHMEDLTSWLAVLSEKATAINPYIRADGVLHGGSDSREKPARTLGGEGPGPDREALVRASAEVMPKGRNFQ